MLIVGYHRSQLPDWLSRLRSHIRLIGPLGISAPLRQAACHKLSIDLILLRSLLLKFIDHLLFWLLSVFVLVEHDGFELPELQVVLVDVLTVDYDAFVVLRYVAHLKHIF